MRRGRALALAALSFGFLFLSLPSAAPASAADGARPGVAIVLIEDRVSFEQLIAVPTFRDLARSGGAALMATDQTYRSRPQDVYLALGAGAAPRNAVRNLLVRELALHGVALCGEGATGSPTTTPLSAVLVLGAPVSSNCGPTGSQSALLVVNDQSNEFLATATGLTELLRPYTNSSRLLFMVITPSPSSSMNRIGDEVMPLVMAEFGQNELSNRSRTIPALTSDTTRRDGLVANVDVAPTILQFFGIPIPSEIDGQPIRTDGQVDLFALHRLHLEQRRIRLPIQMGELGFVCLLAIIGIPLLFAVARRGSLPSTVAAAMRIGALGGAAFGIVLLAGGLLPRLTWAVVIPYLVLATAGLAAVSLAVRKRGAMAPFVFIGAVGLVFIVVEGALGGRAFGMPLLGGTMFDGVRYYGLPNAFISILLGSALLVAAALNPLAGTMLLFAVGLFAGFPGVGADVGGSITLFAAAGVWWAIRVRTPPRGSGLLRWPWMRMAVGLAVAVVAGLAIVLIANRYLPGAPTHATRFVERATGRFGSAVSEVRHRLGTGWRMLTRTPPAGLPLVGLAVVFVLALTGPGPIGRGLDRFPPWREVLMTLAIAAAVAFVANDTGVAASAPAFLYVATVLAYVGLRPEAWAHPPQTPPAQSPVTTKQPQGIS